MAIGPREVMRSDVEGGLSGPANPIPNESLDCGCGQFPCPRLAKFATRRLFVGLLCWIGIVQSAAYAYLYVTSPTISRRFQFDPFVIEWILIIAEVTRFLLGFLVAYWGDRIHRAAWTGALVLVQSASFLVLIIPNFTHNLRITEEPENLTHMSVYDGGNPELCSFGLARSIAEENQFCYATLALLVALQIFTGMANVAYYALGISYLDDNTKKRHVGALIGVVVAMKVLGILVGYILAWGCLKLDSDNLQIVVDHREQMGAWWLGWPVLAILLGIPGMLVSWLPRRLPSEVVEQAAASILDLAGRSSPSADEIPETPKVGDTGFFASLLRLCSNKILICNVFAAIFCCTALINFVSNENIFLESRYYVPRPTATLLGFGDPLWSRVIANMLKPVIIGTIIIVSGMVIMRVRPRATSLTIYNVVVFVVAATMIFSLVYATCKKPAIAGQRGGSTYHAGCRTMNIIDNVRIYDPCSCVEDVGILELNDTRAPKGPCGSSTCQIGWLVFEIMTTMAYSLAASSLVGSFLIILRSVYVQDKALAIGFWMTLVSVFAYVPGKLAYKKIADVTCKHWSKTGSLCYLHDDDSLANYMCYLTAFLLILAAAFEIVLWYFCRKLRLYGNPLVESARNTELREVERNQAVPLLDGNSADASSKAAQEDNVDEVDRLVANESTSVLDLRERKIDDDVHQQSGQLKYGPLGPGDRRTTSQGREVRERKMRTADTDDELESSSDDEDADVARSKKTTLSSSPQVAYRPLDLDSDVESDLSSIGPRSRRRIPSGIFDDLAKDDQGRTVPASTRRPFPNPDDYENPSRKPPLTMTKDLETPGGQGGFSRTNSFEFSKNKSANNDPTRRHEGDFNEVGIPVMTPLVAASFLTSSGHARPEVPHQEVQVLLPRHQKQASQDRLDTIRSLLESVDENRRHRLGHEPLREEDNENNTDVPPPIIGRPPSRDQASSGFGSSPDVGERMENVVPSSGRVAKVTSPANTRTNSPKGETTKGSPLSTAL